MKLGDCRLQPGALPPFGGESPDSLVSFAARFDEAEQKREYRVAGRARIR
jgi:hypothetical protein